MVGQRHCTVRALGSGSLFGDQEFVVVKALSKGYCTGMYSWYFKITSDTVPKKEKGDLGLDIPLMQNEHDKNLEIIWVTVDMWVN